MIKDIDIIKEHLIGYIEVELPYPFKKGEDVKSMLNKTVKEYCSHLFP